jgi:predicted amidohydrolase YtcJ
MTATLLAMSLLAGGAMPSAELAIVNAKIWTGDAAKPEAEAIAFRAGRIVAVGTAADVRPWIGPTTKELDARGRRVVPGFYDSHVHFLGGGRSLAQVQLKDAKDLAEFQRRLRAYDAKTSKARWLVGGQWDHDRALAGVLPTKELIDAAVNDRPVFIRRYDGHMALANTKALELAKIDAKTPDPAGGVIERDSKGNPTGLLKDNAMELVERLIPEPEDDEILEAVQAAMAACIAQGITSVTDMDGNSPATRKRYFALLQRLERAGKLQTRIELRWPIAQHHELSDLGLEANFGSEFLRLGGLKGFMDGSLGSSTAKMFAPYEKSASTGVFVTEPATMKALVRSADRANLSVAIHAIGDRANGRRHRIEHVQHLRPQDYPRFKAINVVASMQPYHVIDDGRWAEGRIGAARCASSYAYRSLLDHGAVLAFGSDWPVAPLNVLEGIEAAVLRQPLDGKHLAGWYPAQRIGVAEALRAYSWGSAYAARQEKERSQLAVGQMADAVILSADPLFSKEIRSIRVDATILAGRVVYERTAKP